MARRKREKYQQNKEEHLILQEGNPLFDEAKMNRNAVFQNDNPLVLELACGKGEYSVGLAPHFPEKNFVGVDLKGIRLWAGAQKALAQGLKNVAFLRLIIQNIHEFFPNKSVDEIWIIHPDPRPRGVDARRRLTHPRFLKMYEDLLRTGGLIRLKTDDPDLFAFSLDMCRQEGREIIESTNDLDNSPLLAEHYGIQTNYEKMFKAQGRTICYLKARKI